MRLIGSRGQQNVIKIGKKNSDTVLWIKNYNKNAIGFYFSMFLVVKCTILDIY